MPLAVDLASNADTCHTGSYMPTVVIPSQGSSITLNARCSVFSEAVHFIIF